MEIQRVAEISESLMNYSSPQAIRQVSVMQFVFPTCALCLSSISKASMNHACDI